MKAPTSPYAASVTVCYVFKTLVRVAIVTSKHPICRLDCSWSWFHTLLSPLILPSTISFNSSVSGKRYRIAICDAFLSDPTAFSYRIDHCNRSGLAC